MSNSAPYADRESKNTGNKGSVPSSVKSVLRSSGSAMPATIRGSMESKFGRDFSSVRIHTNTMAQTSAAEINAKAYSFGNNVVMGRPTFASDPRILSHELTHVSQNNNDRPVANATIGESSSRESEATANESAGSAHVASTTSNSIQRMQAAPETVPETIANDSSVDVAVEPVNTAENELEEKESSGEEKKGMLSQLYDVLRSTGIGYVDAWNVLKSPKKFLGNLHKGIGGGLRRFIKNIKAHLKTGFMEWLMGAMGNAGFQLPTEFTPKSMFGLAMNVLGLTYGAIRTKIAKVIGEKNVARAERTVEVVKVMATEGVSGAWSYFKDKLTGIKETIVGGVKNFVVTRVLVQGVKQLVGWLNPAGAIVNAAQGVYRFYTFIRDNAARFLEISTTILSAVASIAKDQLGGVVSSVENVLGKGVTVAIDLFAKLLSLGGIGKKIRDLVGKMRKPIEKAIARLVDRVSVIVGGPTKPPLGSAPANSRKLEIPWAWGNANTRKYHLPESSRFQNVQKQHTDGKKKNHWVRIADEKDARIKKFEPAFGAKATGDGSHRLLFANEFGGNQNERPIRARVNAIIGDKSVKRRGLEKFLPAKKGFERGHLYGPILGGEVAQGIMYVRPHVNGSIQKKIENRIKRFGKNWKERGERVEVNASVVSFSATEVRSVLGNIRKPNRFARRYDYSLSIYRKGNAGVTKETPYGTSARPEQVEKVTIKVPLPHKTNEESTEIAPVEKRNEKYSEHLDVRTRKKVGELKK